jgi:hypothetical protein
MRVTLFQPLELTSIRKSDETPVRITVRLVGDLVQGDAHYLQFFNILMRKCLGHLDLQLVGRHFFDAKAKVIFTFCNIVSWPHESAVKPFTGICYLICCACYVFVNYYTIEDAVSAKFLI